MTVNIPRESILFLALFFSFSNAIAQTELSYYLPENVNYNENIPTPASIIGHEIGEWHVTHDKLTQYFYELGEFSERVKVEKIGQTYEFRPLLNVIITSKKNHDKLEQLRLQHLQLSDPNQSDDLKIENMPVVVRLGYSVHGNEQSGANASLLVAYHLAAAQGEEIDKLLENCIILIDPSLNPDGLQRFSTWVNEHKSKNMNTDPNGREFGESWPGGRTNHYWFDLNRDWLLAQHPESIARLKAYHDWMPNIQTDHHEMGSDATFFFQPGIPSRKHPLIPETNVTLTEKIGKFHANILDKNQRLYYTKESFDDFYFGKGSTYPDIQGGVGILFEQASSRGHLRETENGTISFPFTIKGQFLTSLSTLEAAETLKTELLDYQRSFYKDAVKTGESAKGEAIIFGTKHDPARAILLGQVLLRHKIELYEIQKDTEIQGKKFYADRSFVVPLNQPQGTLVKAIFERRTSFKDSLFYDVSAWDFDLSYNTGLAWISGNALSSTKGEQVEILNLPDGNVDSKSEYAYLIDWNQYYAPGLLNVLLKNKLIVKVASEPFSDNQGQEYRRGSILIPVGIQGKSSDEVFELLSKYASKYHVKAAAIKSGFSSKGVDLGSNAFINVRQPKIGLLVNRGVSGYEAGEVWHLLDQRYDMFVSLISTDIIERIKLGRYNVLILPGGSYSSLNSTAQERLKEWVKNGGTLIAWKDALRFVSKLQIADLKFKKAVKDTTSVIPYSDRSKARGAQVIGGAIFNMEIDETHPLAYGYDQKTIPVFKRGTIALEPAKNTAWNPFKYTQNPLLSGYVSKENIEKIKGSPAASIATFGEGKVIAFIDDYNFRAYWYGTNRLFINGIFFGNQISTR